MSIRRLSVTSTNSLLFTSVWGLGKERGEQQTQTLYGAGLFGNKKQKSYLDFFEPAILLTLPSHMLGSLV